MPTYSVSGYTGPYADFTDTITIDGATLRAASRDSDACEKVCAELVDSACPAEYLEVFFDTCASFECRDDLTDASKGDVIVLHAEAYGCDNCQNGECGDNTRTDGCNDDPHGGFLLEFKPTEAENE